MNYVRISNTENVIDSINDAPENTIISVESGLYDLGAGKITPKSGQQIDFNGATITGTNPHLIVCGDTSHRSMVIGDLSSKEGDDFEPLYTMERGGHDRC